MSKIVPVCGRYLKSVFIILFTLYSYLESKDILSKSQSGFRKGDSCLYIAATGNN